MEMDVCVPPPVFVALTQRGLQVGPRPSFQADAVEGLTPRQTSGLQSWDYPSHLAVPLTFLPLMLLFLSRYFQTSRSSLLSLFS